MTLRRRRPGLVYPTWEDWIVVGSGGSAPAFNTGWSNASATYYPKMAFRMRETGIVDLVGCVTTDGSWPHIFTLPAGYRPLHATGIMPFVRQRSGIKSGQLLTVNDTGDVYPSDATTSGDINYISGGFFIDSANAI